MKFGWYDKVVKKIGDITIDEMKDERIRTVQLALLS